MNRHSQPRRRAGLLTAALLLALSPFPAVCADDEDYLLLLETSVGSHYISEGFVRHNDLVYRQFASLDLQIYSLYAHASTVRDFAGYHEDEFVLAYQHRLLENRFLFGLLYSQEGSERDVLITRPSGSVSDLGVEELAVHTETRRTRQEGGEMFFRFLSEEFYYTRMSVLYTFDLESRGSLLNFGLDFSYALSDRIVAGIDILAGLDFGYGDIPGLNGLYHINYGGSLDVKFFGNSGIKFLFSYVVPYREANGRGASKEVLYQANLYFSFL